MLRATVQINSLCVLDRCTDLVSLYSLKKEKNPQNEPGTSSNSDPTVPVLPHHQGQAASSQGLAARITLRMKTEKTDEHSAQKNSGLPRSLRPDR